MNDQIAQTYFLDQTRLFGVVYIAEYTDFIGIFCSVSDFDTVFKIRYRYGDGYSPWGLQNDAPRRPKSHQKTFWTPKGPLSALRGWFWEALGLSRDAPERPWVPLGCHLRCLGGAFGTLLDDFHIGTWQDRPWGIPQNRAESSSDYILTPTRTITHQIR